MILPGSAFFMTGSSGGGDPGEAAISCTMTAGSYSLFLTTYYGFYRASTGILAAQVPNFGTINQQPLSGSTLLALYTSPSGSGFGKVVFSGNQTSTLSELSVWVNGAEFDDGFGSWTYDSGNNRTFCDWSSSPPAFSEFSSYLIEFKEN